MTIFFFSKAENFCHFSSFYTNAKKKFFLENIYEMHDYIYFDSMPGKAIDKAVLWPRLCT